MDRVLLVSTQGAVRSPMAKGFLESFAHEVEVFAAGIEPSDAVHPTAIAQMQKLDIDISHTVPSAVADLAHLNFDFVITLSAEARNKLPTLTGNIGFLMHIQFETPNTNDPETIRQICNEIKDVFYNFQKENLR